jgi:hypothetical protein
MSAMLNAPLNNYHGRRSIPAGVILYKACTMNRKVNQSTLAKIQSRRRRAASDEPSPAISFMAGAAFCFLFFTILYVL